MPVLMRFSLIILISLVTVKLTTKGAIAVQNESNDINTMNLYFHHTGNDGELLQLIEDSSNSNLQHKDKQREKKPVTNSNDPDIKFCKSESDGRVIKLPSDLKCPDRFFEVESNDDYKSRDDSENEDTNVENVSEDCELMYSIYNECYLRGLTELNHSKINCIYHADKVSELMIYIATLQEIDPNPQTLDFLGRICIMACEDAIEKKSKMLKHELCY